MSDWSSVIGKFMLLAGKPMLNDLGKSLYLAIVRQKDELTTRGHFDEDPNYMYETLAQAQTEHKKDDPRPTYKGTKRTKDKDTGITVEEENCDIPLKKFTTITAEAKLTFQCLVQIYFNEVKKYYDQHDHSFPEDKDVLSELVKFSISTEANPVIPFVVYSGDDFQIETITKGGYNEISKKLVDKTRASFKNSEDKSPDGKLGIIVDAFVRFLNVVAVMSADILYEKRQAINMGFIFGVFRIMSSMIHSHDYELDQEVFNTIREYIDNNKPETSETDTADSEKPATSAKKPRGKKAATDETPSTKKPRGRAKKTSTPAADEGDIADEADEAISSAINGGEWEDAALEPNTDD